MQNAVTPPGDPDCVGARVDDEPGYKGYEQLGESMEGCGHPPDEEHSPVSMLTETSGDAPGIFLQSPMLNAFAQPLNPALS